MWTGAPSSLNSWPSWVKAWRWLPSARAAMPSARRARAAMSPFSADRRWRAPGQHACAPRRSRRAWPGQWPRSSRRPRRRVPSGWPPPGRRPRRQLLGLVPAPGVDVSPPERGQARAAGALHAGSPEPLHGILQQGDRQVGFVQEPCGGTGSPQSGLVKGRAADLAQVPDEFASAAERVGAGPYPEPVRAGISARAMAGDGRWFSRRPRTRLTAWRLAGAPSDRRRWPHPRGRPRRGSGRSRDASSATERSAGSAAVRGPSRPAPTRRRGGRSAAVPGPP